MFALYLQQGSVGLWQGLLPLVFIFAVFYLLLILPQQKRQKKWQAMLSDLKSGDKIITSGGVRGQIFAIKDDTVTLRVPPDNIRMDVSRSAIATVIKEDEGQKS
jgi:preprotein translocase subunit YajC